MTTCFPRLHSHGHSNGSSCTLAHTPVPPLVNDLLSNSKKKGNELIKYVELRRRWRGKNHLPLARVSGIFFFLKRISFALTQIKTKAFFDLKLFLYISIISLSLSLSPLTPNSSYVLSRRDDRSLAEGRQSRVSNSRTTSSLEARSLSPDDDPDHVRDFGHEFINLATFHLSGARIISRKLGRRNSFDRLIDASSLRTRSSSR